MKKIDHIKLGFKEVKIRDILKKISLNSSALFSIFVLSGCVKEVQYDIDNVIGSFDNKEKGVLPSVKHLDSINGGIENVLHSGITTINGYFQSIPGGIVKNLNKNIILIASQDPYLSASGKDFNEINNDIIGLFPSLTNLDLIDTGHFSDDRSPFLKMFEDIFKKSTDPDFELKKFKNEFKGIIYDTFGKLQLNEVYSIYLIYKCFDKIPERSDLTGKNAKISYETRKVIDKLALHIERFLPKAINTRKWNFALGSSFIGSKFLLSGIPLLDHDLFSISDNDINSNYNILEFRDVLYSILDRDVEKDIRYKGMSSEERNLQIEKNKEIINKIIIQVYEIKENLSNYNLIDNILATKRDDLDKEVLYKIDKVVNYVSSSKSYELARSDKTTIIISISILIEQYLIYNNGLRNQVLNLIATILLI